MISKYEMVCLHDHRTTIVLQQQRFEILFDIGAFAILDGYYREAIVSFTSALERFYEFTIRALCLHSGIELEQIDALWKTISNQSERQLGAFIFLWASHLGSTPPTLTNKKISFRNKVIHQGKIPTYDEAFGYGELIYDMISGAIASMREFGLETAIKQLQLEHIMTVQKTVKNQAEISIMSYPTIISLGAEPSEHYNKTLREHLNATDWWRTMFPPPN